MKTFRMLLAPVGAMLLIVLLAGGMPPNTARISVRVAIDPKLGGHPIMVPRGGALAAQLISGKTKQVMSTVKCPQCAPDPTNCPCDSLRNFFGALQTRFFLRIVCQDSAYQASGGHRGKETVIAYYAPQHEKSAKSRDVTRLVNAAPLVFQERDTAFSVTVRIPPVSFRSH